MKYQPRQSGTDSKQGQDQRLDHGLNLEAGHASNATAASGLAAVHAARRLAYWNTTRKLTAWLLVAWFLITFPMIFFARQLSGVVLFGWPLSFYVAAQGAILVYVAIIGLYAWRLRRLDHQFNLEPADET